MTLLQQNLTLIQNPTDDSTIGGGGRGDIFIFLNSKVEKLVKNFFLFFLIEIWDCHFVKLCQINICG